MATQKCLVALGAAFCNPLHSPHLHKPALPLAGSGLARSRLHIHDIPPSMKWSVIHGNMRTCISYFSQSLKELSQLPLEYVISCSWTPVNHQPLGYDYFQVKETASGMSWGVRGAGRHPWRHRGLKGRTSVWRADGNQWAVDSIHSSITSAQGFLLQERRNLFKTSARDSHSKSDLGIWKTKVNKQRTERETKNKTNSIKYSGFERI